MPKKVPDYSNSSIYKLVHKEDFDNENIYIGSTTNFIKRKNMHKTTCNYENNTYYNLKLYQYIRQNGGWDSWCMIQIQPYSCSSKKELETQERYWIETLKPKLNNNIPTRTNVEYYYDNRDKKKEYSKQYYYDNLDKIAEKQKQYRIENKNKIAEKQKQYRIENKNKLTEYDKQYYYDNRDKKIEYAKQKVICDNCGCEIVKRVLQRHKKSQKCINFNSK